MNDEQARLPLPFTAVVALTAGCAAIGLGYLVAPPELAGLSYITIPLFAALFTTLLVVAGERVIVRTRGELESRVVRDPQTGLMTPNMAERVLAVEFAAAQRGRQLSVVLFSIDNFDRNEALHGESASTRWRRAASRVLKQRTRDMNVSARWRGDGVFLSILADVPLEGACTFATRVRREYISLLRPSDPQSFSAGVASYDISMGSYEELVARADRALARAQAEGGKVVMVGVATGGAIRTASEPAFAGRERN